MSTTPTNPSGPASSSNQQATSSIPGSSTMANNSAAQTCSTPPSVQATATPPKEDNYLSLLYKIWEDCLTEYDKSMLFISSGMLIASFAFIEKIVSLATAVNRALLIDGWWFLGASIFTSAIALYANAWVLRILIIFYKKVDENTHRRMRAWGDIIIQIFNAAALIFTIIGSLKIVEFLKLNLLK